MVTIKKILRLLPLLLSFAFVACDSDEFREEPIPEGYGRLRMTIAVPEAAATRTVTGTWLAGEGRELIHEYWVLVVDASNNIADVIHKTVTTNTHDDTEKWHATPAADHPEIPSLQEAQMTQTFYERMFLAEGKPITYLKFYLS